ncbi:Oidioi.mRNA.OKI2018_I69.chr2.g7656.t1.cds [Oikopleura dioica]|uniref:Oidioi.mRNA.OKI2018_I69.chr2.g7656.t1.cds n=1 Tax=Oikopleura dioica TaxID=34765 RepID=A0ABN7TBI5_OIKDI|nr:Oidioi.mRNA.OKI2018_I69.chr2.g7656.t1.cds [Oikopleura dioica]
MRFFAVLGSALAGYVPEYFCDLTANGNAGSTPNAPVNYMCFEYQCPRRENIMQLYNGLLQIHADERGLQVDCRDRSCTETLYNHYEFCIPCCNSPYSRNTDYRFPTCKAIRTFSDACDHFRRFGKFNIRYY